MRDFRDAESINSRIAQKEKAVLKTCDVLHQVDWPSRTEFANDGQTYAWKWLCPNILRGYPPNCHVNGARDRFDRSLDAQQKRLLPVDPPEQRTSWLAEPAALIRSQKKTRKTCATVKLGYVDQPMNTMVYTHNMYMYEQGYDKKCVYIYTHPLCLDSHDGMDEHKAYRMFWPWHTWCFRVARVAFQLGNTFVERQIGLLLLEDQWRERTFTTY